MNLIKDKPAPGYWRNGEFESDDVHELMRDFAVVDVESGIAYCWRQAADYDAGKPCDVEIVKTREADDYV